MNNAHFSFRRAARVVGFAFITAAGASVLPASAQDAPQDAPPPSYARPLYQPIGGRRELLGTVAQFKPYRLLLTGGGRSTQVDLDNRTVITPLGTTLTPGMRVLVAGHWSDGVFIAREIALR